MEYNVKLKLAKHVYAPKATKTKGVYTEWHVFDTTKWAVKATTSSK